MARVGVAIPAGLEVLSLACEGEELVVLAWSDANSQPVPASLTRAERAVLALIVSGDSNAAIARARTVAIRTVANQVASILRKTGASSRFELIRLYAGCRG